MARTRTTKTAAEEVKTTAETAAEEAKTTAETAAAETETTKTAPASGARERTFFKKSIVRFAKYARVRDLLSALLEDGKKYSIREVDEILKGVR